MEELPVNALTLLKRDHDEAKRETLFDDEHWTTKFKVAIALAEEPMPERDQVEL